MDRRIEEHLEAYLSGRLGERQRAEFERALEEADSGTRATVREFEKQARMMRTALAPPDERTPAPGFYGRVMERIESQRPTSVWAMLLEPLFFRRLAAAAFTLLVLVSVAYWTAPAEDEAMAASAAELALMEESEPIQMVDFASLEAQEQNRDVVLVNLATYEE